MTGAGHHSLSCSASQGPGCLCRFYLIDSRHPEPIIDFSFSRIPAFVFTLVNNFLIFMCLMGGMFLIPIFDQTFLGLTATETGLQFVPMAFAIMLAAPIGAGLVGNSSHAM